jgi:hypothetical protein
MQVTERTESLEDFGLVHPLWDEFDPEDDFADYEEAQYQKYLASLPTDEPPF